jgi:hypothetical protein
MPFQKDPSKAAVFGRTKLFMLCIIAVGAAAVIFVFHYREYHDRSGDSSAAIGRFESAFDAWLGAALKSGLSSLMPVGLSKMHVIRFYTVRFMGGEMKPGPQPEAQRLETAANALQTPENLIKARAIINQFVFNYTRRNQSESQTIGDSHVCRFNESLFARDPLTDMIDGVDYTFSCGSADSTEFWREPQTRIKCGNAGRWAAGAGFAAFAASWLTLAGVSLAWRFFLNRLREVRSAWTGEPMC